jgi:hypothetical protein
MKISGKVAIYALVVLIIVLLSVQVWWAIARRSQAREKADRAFDEFSTFLTSIAKVSPADQWVRLAELGPAEIVAYRVRRTTPGAERAQAEVDLRFRRDFGYGFEVFATVTAVSQCDAIVVESGWVDRSWP